MTFGAVCHIVFHPVKVVKIYPSHLVFSVIFLGKGRIPRRITFKCQKILQPGPLILGWLGFEVDNLYDLLFMWLYRSQNSSRHFFIQEIILCLLIHVLPFKFSCTPVLPNNQQGYVFYGLKWWKVIHVTSLGRRISRRISFNCQKGLNVKFASFLNFLLICSLISSSSPSPLHHKYILFNYLIIILI